MAEKIIQIYTDGASRGNPGPGGLGIVLISGSLTKEIAQGYRFTTNNRMELLAVITAIQALKVPSCTLHIFTDSKYVVDAVSKGWVHKWQKIGFKDKKNPDLWRQYLRVAAPFKIQFFWVKGHASNMWNNRCDALATAAADSKQWLIDEGYEQENIAK